MHPIHLHAPAAPDPSPIRPSSRQSSPLDLIVRGLAVDPRWTVRRGTDDGADGGGADGDGADEDGGDAFTWWAGLGARQSIVVHEERSGRAPGRAPERARAPGRVPGRADGTAWTTVTTPVFAGLDAAAFHALGEVFERLRIDAHGAAVRVDRRRGTADLLSRMQVSADASGQLGAATDAVALVTGLAPMQIRHALGAWSHARTVLGASAQRFEDRRTHPTSGVRRDVDVLLTAPDLPTSGRPLRTPSLSCPATRADDLLRRVTQALRRDFGRAGTGRLADASDDHAWFAIDVGERGGVLMASCFEAPLTGSSVALTVLLDLHLDPSDADALAGTLLEEASRHPRAGWTLGSWVVRPHFDGREGSTLLGTTFLPARWTTAALAEQAATAVVASVDLLRARFGGATRGSAGGPRVARGR